MDMERTERIAKKIVASSNDFYYVWGWRGENIVLFTYLRFGGYKVSDACVYLKDVEKELLELGKKTGCEPLYPNSSPQIDFTGRDYLMKWHLAAKEDFDTKILKKLGIKESKSQNIV